MLAQKFNVRTLLPDDVDRVEDLVGFSRRYDLLQCTTHDALAEEDENSHFGILAELHNKAKAVVLFERKQSSLTIDDIFFGEDIGALRPLMKGLSRFLKGDRKRIVYRMPVPDKSVKREMLLAGFRDAGVKDQDYGASCTLSFSTETIEPRELGLLRENFAGMGIELNIMTENRHQFFDMRPEHLKTVNLKHLRVETSGEIEHTAEAKEAMGQFFDRTKKESQEMIRQIGYKLSFPARWVRYCDLGRYDECIQTIMPKGVMSAAELEPGFE